MTAGCAGTAAVVAGAAEPVAFGNEDGDAKVNQTVVVEENAVATANVRAELREGEAETTFGAAEKDQDWVVELVEEPGGLFEEAGVREAPGWAA